MVTSALSTERDKATRRSSAAPVMQVACPQCGHLFPLEARIADQLQEQWAARERVRIRKDVRSELAAELEKEADKRAAKIVAQERRQSEEALREKEKQIASLKRTVSALNKKLPPGRAQELGVVRQETLAELLQARFRADEVTSVPRGVAGADIVQVVRDLSGRSYGSILWESKRAANWSRTWVRKLLDDQKRGSHTVAVIVSDVLPDPDTSLTEVDGVWVVSIEMAEVLAILLRRGVLDVATARAARSRRDDLKGLVYDYLTSSGFGDRIRSIVDMAHRMQARLNSERGAYARMLAERERQIASLVLDVATIYGDLCGIGAVLPSVPSLELEMPAVLEVPSEAALV